MDWHLKLLVGEEGIEIDTVPQVMANASPFFRQMLQPNGFAEGQDISKSGSIHVSLPEDDASAMAILCDIFHLRSRRVPVEEMTSNTMADIATLVDKYDCAAAIQPWPRLWLTQLLDGKELKDTNCMSLGEVGKWIHISSHLGFDEQFSQMTSVLICRASHKDFSQGPLLLDNQKLSQCILDSIENARFTGINAYYQFCFNLIEDRKKGNHCRSINADQLDTFDCSSVALGNAFLAAREVCGEDNWELIENWTESIDEYHQRMRIFAERLSGPQRIAGWNRQAKYYNYETSHSDCSSSQEFLVQVDEIYQNCTVGLKLQILGNHFYRRAGSTDDESG